MIFFAGHSNLHLHCALLILLLQMYSKKRHFSRTLNLRKSPIAVFHKKLNFYEIA